jgi:tryptophan halogenase
MKICIIGAGVSGLMCACELSHLDFISKIIIIESKKIPTIKVGESTTLLFDDFVKKNFSYKDFITNSDAVVKYGVYFDNWSKNSFLNFFGSSKQYLRNKTNILEHSMLLLNKSPKSHFHEIVASKLFEFSKKNEISLDKEENPYSWHFNAGKLKLFLKKHLLTNKKIEFVYDTIIDCNFSGEDKINYLIGENNKKYKSDYFVNCCGDNNINEKIFKEKYTCLSQYLLTNKALVYPEKYVNKRKQFHPYTIAKTMKYGWKWITPTYSRIGTGYVFSDNYVSVDEATNEFVNDVGDKNITPFLVEFSPRYNNKPFKSNNCTIGMSYGFLEPLDAPGLAFSNSFIKRLCDFLKYKNSMSTYDPIEFSLRLKELNNRAVSASKWWCSYILHQYKTCYRDDTQFWIDHKNVDCEFYDQIIDFENVPDSLLKKYEYEMLFRTTSGKDIQLKSKLKQKPFILKEIDTKTIHHLDYIESFYN